MSNLGVDAELTGDSAAEAPADNTDQGLGVVVDSVGREERTAGVALAGVFPALPDAGADHVRGHEVVHLAAVAISEDGDLDLLEMAGGRSTGGKGSPASYGGGAACVGRVLGWQADGLDVRVAGQVHRLLQLQDRDVVLSGR